MKKIGSVGIGDARFLGVVAIVQADRDEFRDAGDRGAEALLAVDGGKLGGIQRGELGQRGRRIGLAVEIPDLCRKIAQLAGFIDQAGLFRALGAVTNKLHFITPCGVFLGFLGEFLRFRASWNSGRGNSTAESAG